MRYVAEGLPVRPSGRGTRAHGEPARGSYLNDGKHNVISANAADGLEQLEYVRS